jgi:hypothetical protein
VDGIIGQYNKRLKTLQRIIVVVQHHAALEPPLAADLP